ncbi:epoxyqueuosine reductase [Chloroflexota bacterium]
MQQKQTDNSSKTREDSPRETAKLIEDSIRGFVTTSPLNSMTQLDNHRYFDEPLVQFADGDDPIFTEYKTVIDPSHLTPREALAQAFGERPEDTSSRISVISWILPITSRTRESNRRRTKTPSRRWAHTRFYGEQFNDALREYAVKLVTDMGHRAVAPPMQPYFKVVREEVFFSNWSERHAAYAAGLGTFSLTDALITERGTAHRCGSIITDLVLPASPRTARDHHANCRFYADGSCKICVTRCPSGALSEQGHDKVKCRDYLTGLEALKEEYGVKITGCGFCQTKVPCEFRNPVKN